MSSTEPTTRQRRAVRTRQAIIDAARELITERGAYGLSLREIARRIEYSPAGLYEYFDGKEAIIQAVIEDGFQKFSVYMLGVSIQQPAEAYLRQLGMAYVQFAVENPEHYMLIFSRPELQNSNHSHNHYVSNATFQTLYQGLQRAVTEGVLPTSLDIDEASFGSWGIVHGMAMLLLTQLKDMEQNWEIVAVHTLDNWFLGLKTRAWQEDEKKSK